MADSNTVNINEAESSETPLAQLVRLRVLAPAELPPHPVLADAQQSQKQSAANGASTTPGLVDLKSFIKQVLLEGTNFADKTVPSTFTPTGSTASPPSEALVAQSQRKISASELLNGIKESKSGIAQTWQDEFWFARKSVHYQDEEVGSANWSEFADGLLRNHSVHEADYTPAVLDSRLVCDWKDQLAGAEFEGYQEVTMCIYEMVHHIPFPLSNRTFPTLVVSALDSPKTTTDSFIIVQIPVDLTSVPAAIYSTGRNRKEGSTAQLKKKTVLGQYVSVERCKVLKDTWSEEDGKVCWTMATASDANGWLPMALQKRGVPSAVAKDVGYFMRWTSAGGARGHPQVTSGGLAS